MASGVGFTNIEEEKKDVPRKKSVSRALSVAFIVLLLIIAIYGALRWWEQNTHAQSVALDQEISKVNNTITEQLTGDVSDFAVRLQTMDDGVYQGYETNDLFQEIENIMIPRVVLKSFKHESGAQGKNNVGGAAGTGRTGKSTVTITADADTFDVMAQQIDMFKKSRFFENVAVGSTDRDDAGRIVFTLTMDVKNEKKSPFGSSVGGGDVTVRASDAQNAVSVTASESAVTVDTSKE